MTPDPVQLLFIISVVFGTSVALLLMVYAIRRVQFEPSKRDTPELKEPKIVHEETDEDGEYHCLDNYAVKYSDGRVEYWVHGVQFSQKMFKDIFVDKSYTPSQILNMKNAEQKGMVIRIIGFDYIVEDLEDFELLDEEEVVSKVDGKPLLYQVIEFKIDRDIIARIVKVQDHSTGKITCLGVPRYPQTRTCMGAIAWTFGMDEWDYRPEVET